MNRICVCLFISSASVLAAWSGAHAQSLPASVAACASESDDRRRLSCYDREIAQLVGSERAESSRAQDVPTPAADEFGYRGKVAREELDRKAAQEDMNERMDATITEVSSRPRGELVITLDNGQIWEQKTANSKIKLEAGDEIEIKKGAFGSFMLVTPSGRGTRVSRVE